MTGCTANFVPSTVEPEQVAVGSIQGSVHGGQAPVTGAQIYLFAAGTTAYPSRGGSATSLITSGKSGVTCNTSGTLNGDCYVTTDNNGNFALTGDYTCTQGTQVYMVAVGGNPGLTTGGFSTEATFSNSSSTITVASSASINVGMTVSGSGVGGTVTAVSGTTVTLSKTTTAGSSENVTFYGSGSPVTTGATFSTGTSTITVASATGISNGMLVSGSGLSGTVTAVNGTTLTLSQTTTAGSVEGVTFSAPATTATFAANSNTITVSSAAGIGVGMLMSGAGFSGTVTAVNGTTITLSQNTTAAGSGVAATATVPVNNAAIVQMAALGQCPNSGSMASQVPWLVINEATTVAFAYSVSGFATTPYNVSTDPSGATALANAFVNATSLVTIGNGMAATTINGNAQTSSPQAKINTLANILSTCVNSSWSGSSNCASLFKYATTNSGTQATDEGSAIFNIVHNQAVQIINGATVTQNATNLLNLTTGATAFSPTVSSVTDWTMPVIYKGVISAPSGANPPTTGPYNIAFDSSGNAWIGDRSNGVVKIEPQGVVSTFTGSGTVTFGKVKGVAVSPQDESIWVTDFQNGDIVVMNSSGGYVTTVTNKTELAPNGPVLTAFAQNAAGTASDGYYAVEVNETSPSVVVFDAVTLAVARYAGPSNNFYTNITTPGWITIDSYGTAWIPSVNNDYAGSLAILDKSGLMAFNPSQSTVGYGYSNTAETMGTAGDSTGNIWAATGVGGSVLVQFAGPNILAEFTSGGLNNPQKTFVDGNNTVWVSNMGANVVSGLYTASGSAYMLSSAGFATSAAAGTGCTVIGVDPSGNVWAGNSDGSVTMLPGLGAPTAAPLYAGTTVITSVTTNGKTTNTTTQTNGNLGTRP